MTKKSVILIVAYTHESRTIGSRGQLPWHDHVLTQDMKTFKQLTTMTQDPSKRNAIVMGRRTWKSLPRHPLPNRLNVVLSSWPAPPEEASGAVLWTNRGLLPTIARLDADDSIETICLIGGMGIYREALDLGIVSAIYATEVGWEPEEAGDCFFPPLSLTHYTEHVLHRDKSHPTIPLTFKCYLKRGVVI